MNIITGSRRSGKTTKMIRLAAERGGYIVCRGHSEAHRIATIARELGVDINFPISYDDFIKRRYRGCNIKEFYIDDIEAMLVRMSTVTVFAMSMDAEVAV
jgi:ABC-type Mn2+/Zn2+ transport system ATPase subunit